MIGTGAMGAPMAQNLIAPAGGGVWSRAPRPDLVASARAANTARARRATDAILVMLPDLPELEAPRRRRRAARRHTAGDLLLLIGSTSSPTGVRALAERLHRQAGAVCRSWTARSREASTARAAGTLSIMLGGDGCRRRPPPDPLSPCGTPVHLSLGAGEVAKACNQLVVAATIALSERRQSSLRARASISTLAVVAAGGGYAESNLLASRKGPPCRRRRLPSGAAKYMVKDLGFAADVAAPRHPTGLLPALRASSTKSSTPDWATETSRSRVA
jgi:2-hydroxy-3-oxopropionate reductase